MLSTPKRGCVNHSDNFCCVCDEYTLLAHRLKLNSRIRYAYERYFACQVGDQDKKWAPHICCNRCKTSLWFWKNAQPKQMPFGIPMVWREQSNHITHCYFCMTNIRRFSRKNKSKISCIVYKSAIKPISHDPDQYLSLQLKKKMLCLLMNVRVPVLKAKKILLNQIPPLDLSLCHSSSIANV